MAEEKEEEEKGEKEEIILPLSLWHRGVIHKRVR
jgi:hypothetical protein